ncbi:5'-methylthioadenosine/S-adenosylhomocysteine nucleosidase [Phenylobacterium sp.]|jgi:adenosylhomocysteine nucleosidase|uniref:5'-methylthioadenosine/S-adenosylhomocysteine nucleosidase n=1 Tax=Phenylobacterium sp. TaxID=1871053 RepID=UPI002F92C4A3
MYGILCATPEELQAVAERLDLHPEPVRHGPTRVWRGSLDGEDLALAQCGIGKVNAAAAATLLLAVFGARALVFSGVAGGLDPELPVGALVLADWLATHDYGVVSAGKFTATASGVIPIGAPPLSELPPVGADVRRVLERLAEAVRDRAAGPVRLGGVVTGDYFLNCAATRDRLRARFGALGVDMESGAVQQVAEAWDVPLYVIRTLSDLAGEESHLTYPQMAEMAARNSALCVPELLSLLKSSAS